MKFLCLIKYIYLILQKPRKIEGQPSRAKNSKEAAAIKIFLAVIAP